MQTNYQWSGSVEGANGLVLLVPLGEQTGDAIDRWVARQNSARESALGRLRREWREEQRWENGAWLAIGVSAAVVLALCFGM